MFAIAPLDWIEWKAVLLLSAPVVFIDEVLKLLTVRPNPFDYQPISSNISFAGDSVDDTCLSTKQDQDRLNWQYKSCRTQGVGAWLIPATAGHEWTNLLHHYKRAGLSDSTSSSSLSGWHSFAVVTVCSRATRSHPVESFEMLRWFMASPSRIRVSSLRNNRNLLESGLCEVASHASRTSHMPVSNDKNRRAISENRRNRPRECRGWRAARVNSAIPCACRGGGTAPCPPCRRLRAPRSGRAGRRARGGKMKRTSLPARARGPPRRRKSPSHRRHWSPPSPGDAGDREGGRVRRRLASRPRSSTRFRESDRAASCVRRRHRRRGASGASGRGCGSLGAKRGLTRKGKNAKINQSINRSSETPSVGIFPIKKKET